MGKPGAGKGDKGKMIEALGTDYGIGRIVTSDMIRENILGNTPLGLEFKKYEVGMVERKLMPTELVLEGLAMEIIELHQNGKRIIILDGAPRDERQAKALLSCHVPFKLFEFDISDKEAYRRDQIRATYEKRLDNGKVPEGLKVFESVTARGIRLAKKAAGVYERIDGTKPMRSQVAQVLRELGFRQHEFNQMMQKLDNKNHPATIIMDMAEGRRARSVTPSSNVSSKTTTWFERTSMQPRVAMTV
ncbi:MAG: nucleoside monophosphate kinase [Patescibacteria group bacterium]|nr:nucleoside monophosphate kinase [Patescibacteria group bacterium]